MRALRITSQILFFLAFAVTFFVFTAQPRGYSFESEWFLWLNPLVGWLTTIASRHWVMPALAIGSIVLILSVFFGRFFCGWLCPLGSAIDFFDRFLTQKMVSKLRTPPRYFQRAKYVFLVALLVLALFGVVFPLIMDPISLLTRIFALVIYPLVSIVDKDALQTLKPVFGLMGLEKFAYQTTKTPVFYGIFLTIAIFAFIVGAGFFDRRFWCQYICPSGAFFGLVSRFAPFRRLVKADKCGECKRCFKACPTHAIADNNINHTSLGECILCGDCLIHDRFFASKKSLYSGCTTFSFVKFSSEHTSGADMKRRHVVAALAAGALLVPGFRASAWNKRDNTGRLIRPPGALPETEFLARCITCGACMKACPTNVLQPCSLDDGLSRLNTPKLVPRIGGCEEKCYLCGQVCPTGAIRALPWEEKRFAKIGTAVIDRHRCLAWAQNRECIVCIEMCPYRAIDGKIVETTKGPFKVPVVFEDACVGCGMCEQQCPINDKAAIEVYKFGENRVAHGPYANDWQKKAILERRKKSDAATSSMPGMLPDQSGAPSSSSSGGMPPGFVQEAPAQGGGSSLPPGFVNESAPRPAPPGKSSGGLPPGFVE